MIQSIDSLPFFEEGLADIAHALLKGFITFTLDAFDDLIIFDFVVKPYFDYMLPKLALRRAAICILSLFLEVAARLAFNIFIYIF